METQTETADAKAVRFVLLSQEPPANGPGGWIAQLRRERPGLSKYSMETCISIRADLSNRLVRKAMNVVRRAPHLIEAIMSGKSTLAEACTTLPPEPARKRKVPVRTALRQEYIDNQSVRAEVWRQLRGALDGIGGMPDAAEAAELMRTRKIRPVIDAKLEKVVSWLYSFHAAWQGGADGEQKG